MKFTHTIITFFFMISVAELFAQKKTAAVGWSIARNLSPVNGQPAHLGVAGPVTGVHGKMMFVAGGANFPDSMPWQGGKKKYHNSVYVFTKKDKQLSEIAGNFRLPENIAYTANCSTPKGVLFAGGENETGISDKVFLMQWDNATKSLVFEKLPALPLALTNAAATCYNDIVFVAGGETRNSVSNKCWSLDLSSTSAGWKELAYVPKPVSHTVLVAGNSKEGLKLYLAGGRKKTESGISELYNSVYEFNVTQNKWLELAPLPYALSAGTGVVAGSDGILLFGGDRGTTFSKVETYIAAISKATNEQEKENLVQLKNQLQVAHPGFSNEVLYYNTKTGKCKVAGSIPFSTPVTTTAFRWGNVVFIPSGEIKAGVRTPQILMAKLRRRLK